MSKKVWAIALAALLMLAFAACGGGDDNGSSSSVSGGSNSGNNNSGSSSSGGQQGTAITGTVTVVADGAAQADGSYLPGVTFTATYSGNVTDAAALRYQWEKGGQPVAAPTGTTNVYTAQAGVYNVVVTAQGFTGMLFGDKRDIMVKGAGDVDMDGTIVITTVGDVPKEDGCTLQFTYDGNAGTEYTVQWFIGNPGQALGTEPTQIATASGDYYVVLSSTKEGVIGLVRSEACVVTAPSGPIGGGPNYLWPGANFEGSLGSPVPKGTAVTDNDAVLTFAATGDATLGTTCMQVTKPVTNGGNLVFFATAGTDYVKRDTAGTLSFWYKGSWEGTIRILLTSAGTVATNNRSIDLAANNAAPTSFQSGSGYTVGSFSTAAWTKVSAAYLPTQHSVTNAPLFSIRMGATGTGNRSASGLCFDEFVWEE